MSRQPLTRTALWVRTRACVPLVLAESRGAAVPDAAAPVADMAAARRKPERRKSDRRTRRRTRRAA